MKRKRGRKQKTKQIMKKIKTFLFHLSVVEFAFSALVVQRVVKFCNQTVVDAAKPPPEHFRPKKLPLNTDSDLCANENNENKRERNKQIKKTQQ